MALFISVISHGHLSVMRRLNTLPTLARHSNVIVLVRDNLGEAGMVEWCGENKIQLESNATPCGFGANNNMNYLSMTANGLRDSDFFIVLNPDVYVDPDVLFGAVAAMTSHRSYVGTVNLFKDFDYQCPDNSVRFFPTFADFVKSFVGLRNNAIFQKADANEPVYVDWAAGSLLIFRSEHYRRLGGFDERFFMYCEDIDICLRSAALFSEKILFMPALRAVHLAGHANRKLFSKHFKWHVASVFRYLLKRSLLRIVIPQPVGEQKVKILARCTASDHGFTDDGDAVTVSMR